MLHDGVLPESALPGVKLDAEAGPFAELAAAAQAQGAGELELVFQACPKLHDGASANNAWLQELPDAITKVTWDNPLLVSPATAAALHLKDEDVVKLEVAGREPRAADPARPGPRRRHAGAEPRLRAQARPAASATASASTATRCARAPASTSRPT